VRRYRRLDLERGFRFIRAGQQHNDALLPTGATRRQQNAEAFGRRSARGTRGLGSSPKYLFDTRYVRMYSHRA